MKQSSPRVFRDADNFPLATLCYERFADRAFARPMAARQRFIDDNDSLVVDGILFSERAAKQQRDAERGKVIWRHDVDRDSIARSSSPEARDAVYIHNGYAAVSRPINVRGVIAVKWLVH